ncbi:hypothetical protein [Streptomyces sp. NBC_01320]|nr:hypothetical protein OG395_56600 [Streptomyces sp. NBC_01320]
MTLRRFFPDHASTLREVRERLFFSGCQMAVGGRAAARDQG